MSRSQKLTALAMTVLTGIALYLFFAVKYRYHLHFQEQYQLFEWTGKYFARVVALPGGLADWAEGASHSSSTMRPLVRC